MEPYLVFAGRNSKTFAEQICGHIGISLGKSEAFQFSDGNTFVRVLDNVRGRDVYIVQSTSNPTNDSFMELLFWIDAFRRSSASSVTAVIPFFSYGKGDKKDEPRVSIRARVCADAIEVAGASRVITMDLHAPQIQGFFKIPVDNLYALNTLCSEIVKRVTEPIVVVSPDPGFFAQARKFAVRLDAPLAVSLKERKSHDEKARAIEVIGDVEGKTAVIVDDFVISGNTLCDTARMLLEKGAKRVLAAVTHGVLPEGAAERIEESSVDCLIVTDTIEHQRALWSQKIAVVSVAPIFAEALIRIQNRASISDMFESR